MKQDQRNRIWASMCAQSRVPSRWQIQLVRYALSAIPEYTRVGWRSGIPANVDCAAKLPLQNQQTKLLTP